MGPISARAGLVASPSRRTLRPLQVPPAVCTSRRAVVASEPVSIQSSTSSTLPPWMCAHPGQSSPSSSGLQPFFRIGMKRTPARWATAGAKSHPRASMLATWVAARSRTCWARLSTTSANAPLLSSVPLDLSRPTCTALIGNRLLAEQPGPKMLDRHFARRRAFVVDELHALSSLRFPRLDAAVSRASGVAAWRRNPAGSLSYALVPAMRPAA
jgi:hypothetical protein